MLTQPRPLPLLYTFRRCPYAIRARLAIHASGAVVSQHEVDMKAKPAEMLAISPKGTVPVLQLPDGGVLEQSLEIMRWALTQHDPQGWLDGADTPEAQVLITLNDGRFKQLLDAYKYPERHSSQSAAAWRDEAVASVLAPLDARLQRQPQLMGKRINLVDMALLPFVRQFAKVDEAWWDEAPLPHFKPWLSQHLASDAFAAVMRKA